MNVTECRISSGSAWFGKIKQYRGTDIHLNLEIVTCDSICTMNMQIHQKNLSVYKGLTLPCHFFSVLKMSPFYICFRGQKYSILHLSCRTSDLQFSLVLQTHALVF